MKTHHEIYRATIRGLLNGSAIEDASTAIKVFNQDVNLHRFTMAEWDRLYERVAAFIEGYTEGRKSS